MKQRRTFFLLMLLGFWACPLFAQDAAPPSPAVYKIGEVAVDVTADSAAKARDQAIAEAQRTAFTQLLERLGANANLGAKLSNDDLSTLVQNFEVRDDRSSSVRYIGTFSVQFRPMAVRAFLGKRNAVFNDTQGKPVLIIPVWKNGDQLTLWDQPNPWQKAWAEAAHDSGIIPVIVPAGSPEDKALLATADAVAGKTGPIQALADHYQASGAVVAVLNGAPDNPAAGFTVDAQHFGGGYDDGSDVAHITVAGNPDHSAAEMLLNQAIQQVRHKIEKEWKPAAKQDDPTAMSSGTSVTAELPQAFSEGSATPQIAVTVQFATLAQWADIQKRLRATPGVRSVNETGLDRAGADIELGFVSTPEDMQMALAQRGLRLTQDILSGQWMLKGF